MPIPVHGEVCLVPAKVCDVDPATAIPLTGGSLGGEKTKGERRSPDPLGPNGAGSSGGSKSPHRGANSPRVSPRFSLLDLTRGDLLISGDDYQKLETMAKEIPKEVPVERPAWGLPAPASATEEHRGSSGAGTVPQAPSGVASPASWSAQAREEAVQARSMPREFSLEPKPSPPINEMPQAPVTPPANIDGPEGVGGESHQCT